MALLDTATLMLALGKQTVDPTLLQRYDLLRRQVEQAVKTYVKWGIEYTTDFIDYFSGLGYKDVTLTNPFVNNLVNVWLDPNGNFGQGVNAFPSSALLIEGQDYALVLEGQLSKSGTVRRLMNNVYWFPSDLVYQQRPFGLAYRQGAYWAAGYGNIKVQYDFGFANNIALSVASWSGGIATLTFATRPGLLPFQPFTISGSSPNGWNGDFRVKTKVDSTNYTIAMPNDPGTYTGNGVLDAIPQDIKLAVETAVSIIQNSVRYGYPTQSENLGDYSYSLHIARDLVFGDVRQLLGPYRDVATNLGW